MNILIGTILLGFAALWLWRQLPDDAARALARHEVIQLARFIFPRIVVALVGGALFADLLPTEIVRDMFGDDAGLWGIIIAALIGPVVPGGPFVCFAIAAAGLQVGATEAAVMAYVTSWSLFSLTKLLAYELPILGVGLTGRRLILSLPIPIIVGLGSLIIS